MHRGIVIGAIAAILGALVGAAITLVWQHRWPSSNHEPASPAAQILAKVSRNFVAQKRIPNSGITFFDQPKPYGDWLCRVRAIYVPEKVLTGKPLRPQDPWEDDLDASDEYGVWREPHLGAAHDGAREKACARFRDFDHMFIAQNSADPERGAFLLDKILEVLRSEDRRIPFTCSGMGQHGKPESCDPRSVLKSVTLRSLRQVEAVSEKEINGGMIRTDLLWLPADPKAPDGPEQIELTVVSEQRFGKQSASEGDLRSVNVKVECFC